MAGILPMFGFPTQVRVLYTAAPVSGREPSTLDRDAGIAISEFAPGSEVVKDKAIHTAVGVVDYFRRQDGSWAQGDDPLGDESPAWMCAACTHISLEEHSAAPQCPTCQAPEPLYAKVILAQPLGYRTSFKPRDYEQLARPDLARVAASTRPPRHSRTSDQER